MRLLNKMAMFLIGSILLTAALAIAAYLEAFLLTLMARGCHPWTH